MLLDNLIKIHRIVLYCAILACAMYAQDTPSAKVYKGQFVELHAKTTAILHRADELVRRGSTDSALLDLQEEIFAITKLVHRLGEESARSNVDVMKKGQSADKTLLLVSSGCEEMSFVLQEVDNFLDTKDRAFLGFAKRGDDITSSLQDIL